jgi:hypothetical protein
LFLLRIEETRKRPVNKHLCCRDKKRSMSVFTTLESLRTDQNPPMNRTNQSIAIQTLLLSTLDNSHY